MCVCKYMCICIYMYTHSNNTSTANYLKEFYIFLVLIFKYFQSLFGQIIPLYTGALQAEIVKTTEYAVV